MNSAIFEEIYSSWKNNFDDGTGYSFFAKKFGYETSEGLRSAFRRWRKQRGLRREDNIIENKTIASNKTNAKILCFDVETSPICALVWGIWDQNIYTDAIINDWHLLSWSAKWLFDDHVMSDVLTPEEALKHDDSRIVKKIWNLLNTCDITISHNGDKFDCKRLNTRFLFHGLPPVSKYKSIDTLLVAKSNFNFTSNKLDYINQYLGLPQKTETGMELWKKAYFGDAKSLKDMEEYCSNDVEILEDLYLKLRPYIHNHPNLNLWSEENVSICPNCGSENINWHGHYYTYTGRYKSFTCSDCGANGRARYTDLDKEKRKTVVRT